MKDRNDADWEELARREPYFTLRTNDGGRAVEGSSIATSAYLETGESDIAALLAAIHSLIGRELALKFALDFGCGAGRLTLPLARRADRVVACDVAPTMLAHVRQNAADAGLTNVTTIESSELAASAQGQFDFVCALLVFPHIPAAMGYPLIRILLNALAPGGVAALNLTLRRVRLHGSRSRPVSDGSQYTEQIVRRSIEGSGARLAGLLPIHDRSDSVLIIEKRRASS